MKTRLKPAENLVNLLPGHSKSVDIFPVMILKSLFMQLLFFGERLGHIIPKLLKRIIARRAILLERMNLLDKILKLHTDVIRSHFFERVHHQLMRLAINVLLLKCREIMLEMRKNRRHFNKRHQRRVVFAALLGLILAPDEEWVQRMLALPKRFYSRVERRERLIPEPIRPNAKALQRFHDVRLFILAPAHRRSDSAENIFLA